MNLKTLYVRDVVNVGAHDERLDFVMATPAQVTPHIQMALIEADGSRPWQSLHDAIERLSLGSACPERDDTIRALKALDFRFLEIFK